MGRVRTKTVKKVRAMYRCVAVDEGGGRWTTRRWMDGAGDGENLKDRDARDDDGGRRCRARGDG